MGGASPNGDIRAGGRARRFVACANPASSVTMTGMTDRAVVIGAGMAGLWTALALAPSGCEVVLLDRDQSPPEGGPDAAFLHWARRGVGHLRHSHAFLARLRLLLRDRHPVLLQALLDAGCRELRFEDVL